MESELRFEPKARYQVAFRLGAKFSLRIGKSFLAIVALSSMALLQTGCSASGEISDIVSKSAVLGVSVQGLISGATATEKTSSGYLVSTSLGAWNSGDMVQTTTGGYKVYQNVQGVISADQ